MENKKSAKPLKFLIAEDEGDICLLLNIMLKKDDIDIEHVNTLAKASSFLNNEHADVVILDNRMPDGLGIDYLTELKKNHPETKVIMMTANTTDEDKNKAMANGADIFLSKPFTKDQIKMALNKLVQYDMA